MKRLADAFDLAQQLPLEDQEELVSTLRRRIAEKRRQEIVRDVMSSRRELRSRQLRPATVKQIMALVRS